jgi:hypothetical protein
MAVYSKIMDVLPEHYGYVLFPAVGSVFVNMWMAMNVGKARTKFGIEVSFNFYFHVIDIFPNSSLA